METLPTYFVTFSLGNPLEISPFFSFPFFFSFKRKTRYLITLTILIWVANVGKYANAINVTRVLYLGGNRTMCNYGWTKLILLGEKQKDNKGICIGAIVSDNAASNNMEITYPWQLKSVVEDGFSRAVSSPFLRRDRRSSLPFLKGSSVLITHVNCFHCFRYIR